MDTGVLGGAFNPPHNAHLLCAQEARVQLALDSVLIVPVGRAPHRELDPDPGPEARARMCELAVEGDERLEVSRLELEREGPSYTADTLAALAVDRPGDRLTLILGADQAASLPDWERPEEVLGHARIAVAERGGLEREAVLRSLGGLERAGEVTFFEMPRLDVSSSLVRERVANGRPIRYLLPDNVIGYIGSEGLYGGGDEGVAG